MCLRVSVKYVGVGCVCLCVCVSMCVCVNVCPSSPEGNLFSVYVYVGRTCRSQDECWFSQRHCGMYLPSYMISTRCRYGQMHTMHTSVLYTTHTHTHRHTHTQTHTHTHTHSLSWAGSSAGQNRRVMECETALWLLYHTHTHPYTCTHTHTPLHTHIHTDRHTSFSPIDQAHLYHYELSFMMYKELIRPETLFCR